jgi:hypothetical protein
MKTVRIDVTLLDKSKFYHSTKPAKDGHLPIYCDIVLFENREGVDQYGNLGFASQSISKQDRENGVKMPILGNWKEIGQVNRQDSGRQYAPPSNENQRQLDNQGPLQEDDIPF